MKTIKKKTKNIDLNTNVKTIPMITPIYGSVKIQMDIFEIPN